MKSLRAAAGSLVPLSVTSKYRPGSSTNPSATVTVPQKQDYCSSSLKPQFSFLTFIYPLFIFANNASLTLCPTSVVCNRESGSKTEVKLPAGSLTSSLSALSFHISLMLIKNHHYTFTLILQKKPNQNYHHKTKKYKTSPFLHQMFLNG